MKAHIGVDAELGQAHASVGKAEHLGSSQKTMPSCEKAHV